MTSTAHPISTSPSLPARFNWRDLLPVHPAAELFPLMSEAELRELAENIKANGLRVRIVTWWPPDNSSGPLLLDGRNRFDALALLGLLYRTEDGHLGLRKWCGDKWSSKHGDRIMAENIHGGDPYAIAISLNIHRRHLTPKGKRNLIAKLLKATPGKSDRQIAETIKASPTTVGKVRKELEHLGDVSSVDTRTDTKGRRQPARKRKVQQTPNYEPIDAEAAVAQLDADAALRLDPEDIERLGPEAADKARARAAERAGEIALRLKLAGKAAREVFWKLAASPNSGGDVGPNSSGENERLRARIAELEAEKRRLEIKVLALESEIAKLARQVAADGRDDLRIPDDLSIPAGFLRRGKQA
jgi:hypothetical protein